MDVVGGCVALEMKNVVDNKCIITSVHRHFGNVPLYDPHVVSLKEYYEIVGESRPLSAFFPTHADFFTEMHSYS